MIAGIDWSMTSPAITIGPENPTGFSDLLLFGYRKEKKQFSNLSNVFLSEYPEQYSCNAERFDSLSNWAIDILDRYRVTDVYMEGYSYGSKGNLCEIGENTGLLKYKLWKSGMDLEIFAPSEIKKFATGKGNANKDLMMQSFEGTTGIDIITGLGSTRKKDIPAPCTDLVDSYWIYRIGIDRLNRDLNRHS